MTGLFGWGSKESKEIREKKAQLKKFVKAKNYDQALKVGDKILEKRENDHDVIFVIGSIHYMRGQYLKSISYFDRALKIGSYDPEALLLKANAHYKLGQISESKSCCEKIKEIDPKNKGVQELYEKISKS